MGISPHPWMVVYWKLCWRFITPTILIVILVEQFVSPSQVAYGPYVFPYEIQMVGRALGWVTTSLIPLTALWKMEGKHIGNLFQPSDKWGPADVISNHNEAKEDIAE